MGASIIVGQHQQPIYSIVYSLIIGTSGVKGKALGYPNPSSAVEQASNFEELTLKTQSLAGKVRESQSWLSIPWEANETQTSYIFQILAPLGLGFIKCSIVSLYRRIFCVGIGVRDPFDLTTRIMLIILALWSVAFGLAFVFICGINFSQNWQPVLVAGVQCPLPIIIAYVISDAILDLSLLIMPIPLVRYLY